MLYILYCIYYYKVYCKLWYNARVKRGEGNTQGIGGKPWMNPSIMINRQLI